jgi:hypothetical protein
MLRRLERAAAQSQLDTRVLRAPAEDLPFEDVRSDDERVARHQDRMVWIGRIVGRCDCNRPTHPLVVGAATPHPPAVTEP